MSLSSNSLRRRVKASSLLPETEESFHPQTALEAAGKASFRLTIHT